MEEKMLAKINQTVEEVKMGIEWNRTKDFKDCGMLIELDKHRSRLQGMLDMFNLVTGRHLEQYWQDGVFKIVEK